MRRIFAFLTFVILCGSCYWKVDIDYPDYPHSEHHPDYKSEMWYTTTNDQPIVLTKTSGFGIDIIDMTYADGHGVITFDGIVRRIGEQAFRGCMNLKSVSLPDSTRLIRNSAFAHCISLEEVIMPDSLMAIESEVFALCNSLSSIRIPKRVKAIGRYAFLRCDNLREFTGELASEDGRTIIIDSLVVAFAPADIEGYSLSKGANAIGEWVFSQCNNLRSVTISDNIRTIDVGAFAYCSQIEEITFGEGVTAIGSEVMRDCLALRSVYMRSMTPPTIDLTTFSTHNYQKYEYEYLGCDIYVPYEALSAYREADVWRDYAEYIKGYNPL